MQVSQIVTLAATLADSAQMRSSARLCADDAAALLATGDTTNAKARALRSLAYSVGIFHPTYKAAAQ